MYLKLYKAYLGEALDGEPSDSGFISLRCPFTNNHDHGDRRPSAGVNPASGTFNCYKCGSLSPVEFLSRLLSIPETEAFRLVDEFRQTEGVIEYEDDFVNFRVKSPNFERLSRLSVEQISEDMPLVQQYCSSRGLKFETLAALGVGYLSGDHTHWKRPSLVFSYVLDGGVVGIRYRDGAGSKGGEPGCHFTLWGLDDIVPELHTVAIVVEGESDRLATYQALADIPEFRHIAVLSTPTAAFRLEWEREFHSFRRVLLIPQADEASLKMTRKAKSALGEKLTICQLPWKRRQVGKDVCDWLHYHKLEEFYGLLRSQLRDVDRRILSGAEFKEMANKPRRWVIENLLANREVFIIGGHQKSYKTWIALNLMRSLVQPGLDFLGIPGLVANEKKRVLIIEEEGDPEGLYSRADMVLRGTDWLKHTYWSHQLRIKFDDEASLTMLERIIRDEGIDVLIGDPFQRLHTADENSASEMGRVWESIHYLTGLFPTLAPGVLQHFHKMGLIEHLWNAFRGSNRSATEADVGMFVERHGKGRDLRVHVAFDGRSMKPILTPEGEDVFKLEFDGSTGLLLPQRQEAGTRKVTRRSSD